MGTSASNTTLAGIIDEVYPRDVVVDEIFRDLPEMAMAKKVPFAGTKHRVRVKVAGQQGRQFLAQRDSGVRGADARRDGRLVDRWHASEHHSRALGQSVLRAVEVPDDDPTYSV